MDIELKRILHQLRTAPERWLWRVHEALDFATSRRLAGATFMCVLIGLTLIAWVRPYPLFSPESHERPEEVSTEAKLQR